MLYVFLAVYLLTHAFQAAGYALPANSSSVVHIYPTLRFPCRMRTAPLPEPSSGRHRNLTEPIIRRLGEYVAKINNSIDTLMQQMERSEFRPLERRIGQLLQCLPERRNNQIYWQQTDVRQTRIAWKREMKHLNKLRFDLELGLISAQWHLNNTIQPGIYFDALKGLGVDVRGLLCFLNIHTHLSVPTDSIRRLQNTATDVFNHTTGRASTRNLKIFIFGVTDCLKTGPLASLHDLVQQNTRN